MTAPRPVVGGPPLRLGPRVVGEPVRTPWNRTTSPAPVRLDDLADVASPAPPTDPPTAVLARGRDGVYRPVDAELFVAAHQRGDVTHYVATAPTTPSEPPAGVRVGEHVVALDTGTVYRLED